MYNTSMHPSPNEDISTYYNMIHNVMRDMSGDVYYLSGHSAYVLGRIFRFFSLAL